ncbi:hypothetical protein DLAC_11062 [Tieghemostelium lacteum]|uniref:Uncharacterized protein n=1 Tax=Tieghemostelium lacteum TaxID=361077 RepID=A0A151Z3H0_TIELA|nr:hypothetical protein DLAC_11062 [Tieghemostelium lacteum]|eukprot:KYQ88364.1 hypothetical protein DLAC_11062 [Tieghemostelium lacteum]
MCTRKQIELIVSVSCFDSVYSNDDIFQYDIVWLYLINAPPTYKFPSSGRAYRSITSLTIFPMTISSLESLYTLIDNLEVVKKLECSNIRLHDKPGYLNIHDDILGRVSQSKISKTIETFEYYGSEGSSIKHSTISTLISSLVKIQSIIIVIPNSDIHNEGVTQPIVNNNRITHLDLDIMINQESTLDFLSSISKLNIRSLAINTSLLLNHQRNFHKYPIFQNLESLVLRNTTDPSLSKDGESIYIRLFTTKLLTSPEVFKSIHSLELLFFNISEYMDCFNDRFVNVTSMKFMNITVKQCIGFIGLNLPNLRSLLINYLQIPEDEPLSSLIQQIQSNVILECLEIEQTSNNQKYQKIPIIIDILTHNHTLRKLNLPFGTNLNVIQPDQLLQLEDILKFNKQIQCIPFIERPIVILLIKYDCKYK